MRKARQKKTDFIGTDGEISMTGLSEMTCTPDALQRVTPYGVSTTTMTIEATLPKYLPTTSGGPVMPAEKGTHLLKTLEADCSGASDKKDLVTAMLITEHTGRGIIGMTHTTTETIQLNNIERGCRWDTIIMTIGSPWNLHAKLLRTYLQPFLPPLDGVSYLVIIRFIFHRASSFRRGTPIGQRSHSVKFAIPMGSVDAFLSRVEKNPWPLAMRAYLEPRNFWRSRRATLIEPLLSWQEYRQLRSQAQPVEQYLDGWESGRPVIIGS